MVGMFIFRAVERDDKPDPEQSKPQLLENIKDNITAKYNMSGAEFDSIVKQVEAASSASSDGPEWSYHESISFVVQLVTTIGELLNFKEFPLMLFSFSAKIKLIA